ncbi:MAG: peptidoglycan-associated lipoprotein Pal [Luteitalea sp.]|nr:peptidoglycan-associated lipoprotein Pal [Luteitalea sp.]
MLRSRVTFLLVALTLAVAVAGCGRKKPAEVPAPPPPPPAAAPEAPPPPPSPPAPAETPSDEKPLSEDEIFAGKSLEDLNAEQPLADAFFELDSAELGEEARTSLQKNMEWLKQWPTTKVLIEGHCDERGTTEYNLALGERRATTVSSYLVSLGLEADRVTTVSKGKEDPFCPEQGESCWQQNRRGHFLITAK